MIIKLFLLEIKFIESPQRHQYTIIRQKTTERLSYQLISENEYLSKLHSILKDEQIHRFDVDEKSIFHLNMKFPRDRKSLRLLTFNGEQNFWNVKHKNRIRPFEKLTTHHFRRRFMQMYDDSEIHNCYHGDFCKKFKTELQFLVEWKLKSILN